MQWRASPAVGGVERSALAVQPLRDVELTLRARIEQRCPPPPVVGGIERGARPVQPLSDVEVTLETQARCSGSIPSGPCALTLAPPATAACAAARSPAFTASTSRASASSPALELDAAAAGA